MAEHIIPTLDEMLATQAKHYTYEESFERVQDHPCLICHTSGSTGFPKPIDITHAAMAVYDNQRQLPMINGRRNLGYNLYGGHVYYTSFPPFHLAGICGMVTTTVFYHDSTVVLPAPDMPNNGATACEILRRKGGEVTAMLSPPTVVEQLEHEPGGKQEAARLSFLVSAGGPLGPSAGNSLAEVTDICQFIGSTEIGTIPVFMPAREDWSYFEWHPIYSVKMEEMSRDTLGGIYEAVLPWDDYVCKDLMVRRVCRDLSIPEKDTWRTKDLYRPHPTKPNLWKFHGRTDDIIVLSNGEKFNPVTMEGIIQGHNLLQGAVIVGQARFQASLIIEPKPSNTVEDTDKLIDEVWPIIKKANTEGPDHARIYRSKVIVTSKDKPFQRVGKGTIIREQILKTYEDEIEAMYSDESSAMRDKSRVPKIRSVEDLQDIKTFVQACLASVFETSKEGGRNISAQDDFFVHGLDSLQTVELSHALRAGLRSSARGDLSWLSSKTIYANPTTEALSRSLKSRLSTGAESLDEADESHRIARMSSMVEKYIDSLPRRTSHQSDAPSPQINALAIILTGSTGTLGINILQTLLLAPHISKIYCLNRAPDAQSRLLANFASRGVASQYESHLSKTTFLQSNFGHSTLGLSESTYSAILEEAGAIIHNAWSVNFNQTLDSFEQTHIAGIRHMVDLSLASKHKAHIHFISSLSSVGNWSAYNPNTPITESPLTEYGVAQKLGYGESKHVSERILQIAAERSGVSVNILRVGQVAGPNTADGTEWHRHEWLPSLIRTSKALGKIPETLTAVDWVTVDGMANIIVDLVHSGIEQERPSPYLRIFNLLNPKTATWKDMAIAVQSYFGPGTEIKTVSFQEWIKEVEKTDMSNTEEVASKPAAKILDFYAAMAKAGTPPDDAVGGFETEMGRRYSRTFAELRAVDRELMRRWLRRWEF